MEEHNTIMHLLRDATTDLHAEAESKRLQRQIARGTVERRAFAAYLCQLHHVHDALESALRRARERHAEIAALATDDRMRVPDLERDLSFYGADAAASVPGTAASRFIARLREAEDADPVILLGALYVLEGSTNGGRFLANVLRRSWELDGDGLAYLDPYGDLQPQQWAVFRREMNAAKLGDEQKRALIEMARATFQAVSDISDEVAAAGPTTA